MWALVQKLFLLFWLTVFIGFQLVRIDERTESFLIFWNHNLWRRQDLTRGPILEKPGGCDCVYSGLKEELNSYALNEYLNSDLHFFRIFRTYIF